MDTNQIILDVTTITGSQGATVDGQALARRIESLLRADTNHARYHALNALRTLCRDGLPSILGGRSETTVTARRPGIQAAMLSLARARNILAASIGELPVAEQDVIAIIDQATHSAATC